MFHKISYVIYMKSYEFDKETTRSINTILHVSFMQELLDRVSTGNIPKCLDCRNSRKDLIVLD